ncbi:efflux RND transporter permease subunit, partial [Klebsiella pneumoniae]
SGTAVFRLTSRDGQSHRAAAEKLLAALQAEPGIGDVSSDAERHILQVDVQVDQVKAQAAGVSSADIAKSLELMLAGSPVTQFREGDTVL